MANEPHAPHDALVQMALSTQERAAAYLKSLLKPEITSRIDWATLKREPGMFVSPKLRRRYSDYLFSAMLDNRQVLVYVLVEHQSRGERYMLLRMMQYMIDIWRQWLSKRGGSNPLPIIVPVLLSNTKRGWKHAVVFHGLFEPGQPFDLLKEYIPSFSLLVDDLHSQSDEAIKARVQEAFVALTLLLLRNAPGKKDLAKWLKNNAAELLRQLAEQPEWSSLLLALIEYMLTVAQKNEAQDITEVVGELLGKEAELMADTIADRLVQRGKAEGLRQAVEDVCLLLNIQLTADRKAFLLGLNVSDLNDFRATLLEKREWPGAVSPSDN